MASCQFIALAKVVERYIFFYNEQNIGVLLQTFAKFAADPDLDFTWYDAAYLAQKIRKKT